MITAHQDDKTSALDIVTDYPDQIPDNHGQHLWDSGVVGNEQANEKKCLAVILATRKNIDSLAKTQAAKRSTSINRWKSKSTTKSNV
jgi:hypothetical protein